MASLASLLLKPRSNKPPKRKADQADSVIEGPLDVSLPHCTECLTKKTPLWRWDPAFSYGIRRLCNACGCAAARKARKGYAKHRRESSEGTDRDHWGGDWGSVSSSDEDGESPLNTADAKPRKLRNRCSSSIKAKAAAEWLREADEAEVCEEERSPAYKHKGTSSRPQRTKASKQTRVAGGGSRALSNQGKENSGSISHRKRARKQSCPMRAD